MAIDNLLESFIDGRVSSVLQPYSPKAMVKTALESANKSRLVWSPNSMND
jgi:hypothetical protein